MNKQLNILYFSATCGTAKVVKAVAAGMKDIYEEYDITSPISRKESITFNSNDLVIIGVPVYAGRVPQFLIDYFCKVKGNHTPAVFVTVYGNCNYDDALLELKNTLERNGFVGISAGAFIAEHSNTSKVGTNRPDAKDLKIAKEFGAVIKTKLENAEDILQLPQLIVKGNTPYKERMSAPPIVPDTSDD